MILLSIVKKSHIRQITEIKFSDDQILETKIRCIKQDMNSEYSEYRHLKNFYKRVRYQ